MIPPKFNHIIAGAKSSTNQQGQTWIQRIFDGAGRKWCTAINKNTLFLSQWWVHLKVAASSPGNNKRPHLYKKALANTQKASELHDLRLIQPLRAFEIKKNIASYCKHFCSTAANAKILSALELAHLGSFNIIFPNLIQCILHDKQDPCSSRKWSQTRRSSLSRQEPTRTPSHPSQCSPQRSFPRGAKPSFTKSRKVVYPSATFFS